MMVILYEIVVFFRAFLYALRSNSFMVITAPNVDNTTNKKEMKTNVYKRKKSSKTKATTFDLKPNERGIFITCLRGREKASSDEALYLLEQLVGYKYEENCHEDKNVGVHSSFSNSLEAELSSLRTRSKKDVDKLQPFNIKRLEEFSCIQFVSFSNASNNVLNIVYQIWGDILFRGIKTCKYIQRLLPIEKTCNAYFEDLKATVEQLLDEHEDIFSNSKEEISKDPPSTFPLSNMTPFAVILERRYNSSLNKETVTELIANLILSRKCKLHHTLSSFYVDLKNPKVAIMVQIIKNICGISVILDYPKFKKGNIQLMYDTYIDTDTKI